MHLKGCVLEQHPRAVSHPQVPHTDRSWRFWRVAAPSRLGLRRLVHQLVTTAKRPSITIIITMLDTTAPVAERPTKAAPAPVWRPRWQPIAAIVNPNTAAFANPRPRSPGVTALSNCE